VERNFGYAVTRAYAGHTDGSGDIGATATYVRASARPRGYHCAHRRDARGTSARGVSRGPGQEGWRYSAPQLSRTTCWPVGYANVDERNALEPPFAPTTIGTLRQRPRGTTDRQRTEKILASRAWLTDTAGIAVVDLRQPPTTTARPAGPNCPIVWVVSGSCRLPDRRCLAQHGAGGDLGWDGAVVADGHGCTGGRHLGERGLPRVGPEYN
jgi:hypothetical protein